MSRQQDPAVIHPPQRSVDNLDLGPDRCELACDRARELVTPHLVAVTVLMRHPVNEDARVPVRLDGPRGEAVALSVSDQGVWPFLRKPWLT